MANLTLAELIDLLNECNDWEDPVEPTEDVLDQPYDALGYDSLTLLNAISKLERKYGIELPATITSEAKTPRELLAAVDARLV
ncbi:acyl carrier protein [Streptomyces sp. TLI_171]|uniref:acyl carrier protein n=1 Tax=Streptomyces sp. TLI_171 TaxID=1938859 RepID=UPI000C18F2F0|nr:acyl carrier protein [Streptomyces sp. TLI_171]RKE17913.1 act minimal PKS acyl carrier protein [Streptomyces sp. TLI_171]